MALRLYDGWRAAARGRLEEPHKAPWPCMVAVMAASSSAQACARMAQVRGRRGGYFGTLRRPAGMSPAAVVALGAPMGTVGRTMQPELAMSSAGGDPTMVPSRHMRGSYGRWEPFAQGTQKAPAGGLSHGAGGCRWHGCTRGTHSDHTRPMGWASCLGCASRSLNHLGFERFPPPVGPRHVYL